MIRPLPAEIERFDMNIAIHGISGKMGQEIAKAVLADAQCQLVAASVREGHAWLGKPLSDVGDFASDLKPVSNLELLCRADVVVDFTRPDATFAMLNVCRRFNTPLMIGTTGFTAETRRWIEQAAEDLPIVLAENTSIGVTILCELTRKLAQVLPPEEWDAEILEFHHRRKIDAPSGTALSLGEEIAAARQVVLSDCSCYPHQQARKNGQIGFSSLRGGDIVGEHTVYFIHDDERIELTHRAQNRSVFAKGAVLAAKWLVGKPKGLYTMSDVLNF